MKRLQLYEVGIAVSEIWVFRVEAYSREEAVRLANTPGSGAEQLCTVAGSNDFVKCLGAVPREPKPRRKR